MSSSCTLSRLHAFTKFSAYNMYVFNLWIANHILIIKRYIIKGMTPGMGLHLVYIYRCFISLVKHDLIIYIDTCAHTALTFLFNYPIPDLHLALHIYSVATSWYWEGGGRCFCLLRGRGRGCCLFRGMGQVFLSIEREGAGVSVYWEGGGRGLCLLRSRGQVFMSIEREGQVFLSIEREVGRCFCLHSTWPLRRKPKV